MQAIRLLTNACCPRAPSVAKHTAGWALLCLVVASGCRVPMHGKGVSKSLIESRQLSQQGLSALEQKKYEDAKQMLAKAVDTCGADPEARRHYAEALWHTGARQEALRQLEEAMQLAPSDPALRRKMAEYQLELGRLDRAWQMADEALDLDPRDAASWVVRAKVKERANHLPAALADYQRSLGLRPDQPDVMYAIAELHRLQNQPERALAALQSVCEAHAPGEEPARMYYLMGLAAGALGKQEEALTNYQRARQRGEESPELLYELAQAQWLTGQAIQAEQTATELLARAPHHGPGQQLIDQIRTSRAPGPLLR